MAKKSLFESVHKLYGTAFRKVSGKVSSKISRCILAESSFVCKANHPHFVAIIWSDGSSIRLEG
jgi:hypothetical protein